MSDAYANVVGGSLKLKGGIKKKKKKQEEAPSDPEAVAKLAAAKAAEVAEQGVNAGSSSHSGITEAERKRREIMVERELAKAERGETKSHRQKVKDFNSYLSSLTEHYDLPKVSKGN